MYWVDDSQQESEGGHEGSIKNTEHIKGEEIARWQNRIQNMETEGDKDVNDNIIMIRIKSKNNQIYFK